jgi:hypothetical protein
MKFPETLGKNKKRELQAQNAPVDSRPFTTSYRHNLGNSPLQWQEKNRLTCV